MSEEKRQRRVTPVLARTWGVGCLLLAGLALPRMAAAERIERVFAFVVGVSDYDHPSLGDLSFASRDAQQFVATLTEHLGVPGANITACYQGEEAVVSPTIANVRSAFKAFIKRTAGTPPMTIP